MYKLIEENTIYGNDSLVINERNYNLLPETHKKYFKDITSEGPIYGEGLYASIKSIDDVAKSMEEMASFRRRPKPSNKNKSNPARKYNGEKYYYSYGSDPYTKAMNNVSFNIGGPKLEDAIVSDKEYSDYVNKVVSDYTEIEDNSADSEIKF